MNLLDAYLRQIADVSVITPKQAEHLRQKQGQYITLKYDFQNRYIDEARERELERKYNPEALSASTALTSTSGATATDEQKTVRSYYLHTDEQGSVTAVTDQDGKLIERVEYGLYGYPTFWDYTQDPNNPVKRSRSVIGNNILFHGREYDYELNLYYFRNRNYDPIMGRFLSPDPSGYRDSMNLYQAFNSNPVNFTDPFGLEPVKKYAGIVADIVNAMNNSPSKIGLKKGQQAIKALLYLGQDEISWKSGFPKLVPATTPHFNYKKGRYIYSKKGGWIDMSHFLFYAGRAYIYKIEKEKAEAIEKSSDFTLLPWYIRESISRQADLNPGGEAMQEGFVQERMDSIISSHSAYSYEDLPSDKFGIFFALHYFNPQSNLTLAEQIANFLNNVLGATVPTAAPNWNIMPNKDTKNPPSQTNKTTTPIYTSEDVKKLKLFLQWLDSLFK